MASDPAEYPWSSYHHNAMGQANALVETHAEYRFLGKDEESQQVAYRGLFSSLIPEQAITDIRDATNKLWVLGNVHFKQRTQEQLNRRVEPKARGGDRKSVQYRANRVNKLKKEIA